MFGWYDSPRVNLVSPPGSARPATQPRVARAVAKIATPVLAHRRSRSRSPQRTALPGLRSGAPGRLDRQFVRFPAVLSEPDRVAALEALDRDILAESTHRSNEARLRTVSSALSLWGIPMWPPTAASWKALAATLKAGRYASAALYFSAYRVAAERRGYVLDDLCIRSIKDYTRSCLRGIGEPCRPRALPFHQLGRLPAGRAAWVSGGADQPQGGHCDGFVVVMSGDRTQHASCCSGGVQSRGAATDCILAPPGVQDGPVGGRGGEDSFMYVLFQA